MTFELLKVPNSVTHKWELQDCHSIELTLEEIEDIEDALTLAICHSHGAPRARTWKRLRDEIRRFKS